MALSSVKDNQLDELMDLAGRHKVVYEVRPAQVHTNGETRMIGFEVRLYGTHGKTPHPLIPGCEECSSVWRDLRRVIEAALPPEDRESSYEVQPYQPALGYDKTRESRPDVELILLIGHRHGDALIRADPCESQCLDEIVKDLRQLGVQEKRWDDQAHERHVQEQRRPVQT